VEEIDFANIKLRLLFTRKQFNADIVMSVTIKNGSESEDLSVEIKFESQFLYII